MSDDAERREAEREARKTGAPADESKRILERVRAGEPVRDVHLPAVLHDRTREGVLALLQEANIPEGERVLLFLRNIHHHDEEAGATLRHYNIVKEGDQPPPDTTVVISAILDDLKNNPTHAQAIEQMEKPVLQLIPVYEHDESGFQQIVHELDNRHGSEMHAKTNFGHGWWTNDVAYIPDPHITGWKVAVVDGVSSIPPERNRHLRKAGVVQRIEDQLSEWQEDCKSRGLHLCERMSYTLLQMQQLRLGIDRAGWTVLDEYRPSDDSPVQYGFLVGDSLQFGGFDPNTRVDPDFREMVVIDFP